MSKFNQGENYMAGLEKIKNDPGIMTPFTELLEKVHEILGPSQGNPPAIPPDSKSSAAPDTQ